MEQFICSIEVIFYSETEFPLYLQGKPATEGAHDSKDDPKAETELATTGARRPDRGARQPRLKTGMLCFTLKKKTSYIRFGGAMRRRRAARGAGSLVRDAPPGLGARAGPGRGATPWRGTVCAVLQQGFPVCQPAGSRFSSDFPVVQQGPRCWVSAFIGFPRFGMARFRFAMVFSVSKSIVHRAKTVSEQAVFCSRTVW